MAELLLCHGAEVAVKDRDGRGLGDEDPKRLWWVLESPLLLRRGKTPADVADEEGKKDTAALLRSAAPERPLVAMRQCGCFQSSTRPWVVAVARDGCPHAHGLAGSPPTKEGAQHKKRPGGMGIP